MGAMDSLASSLGWACSRQPAALEDGRIPPPLSRAAFWRRDQIKPHNKGRTGYRAPSIAKAPELSKTARKSLTTTGRGCDLGPVRRLWLHIGRRKLCRI